MTKRIDFGLLGLLIAALLAYYIGVLPTAISDYVLLAVAIIGVLPVLFNTFVSLKNKKISVDLLAAIALAAAIFAHEWPSAVFINLMLTSARLFGYYTENRARASIQSLLKLRPEEAKVKKDGQIIKVQISQLQIGDLVVIGSGERLAVDGIVDEGEAAVDQSSLTGESLPVNKAKNDEVFSSTLAVSGSLIVRTTKVGKDTALEKIISLVESSQNEKAGIRTTADKFAAWYIALTLIGAILFFIFSSDLQLLLAILLVACADDIAVAIPLAFLAAIGYAARRGVIIKGSAYLEGLTQMKTLVLDKTGTLTQGRLAVANIFAFDGFKEKDVLFFAAIAESVSGHPAGKAVIRYAKKQGVIFKHPEKFKEFPGRGITALYEDKEIVCGKEFFLKEKNVIIREKEEGLLEKLAEESRSSILVGYGGQLVGFISATDELRSGIKANLEKIRKLGVSKIIMLTGDNEKTAARVAAETGITEYHSGLLPEDKIAYIKKNIGLDGKLGMVGDGVNDAASLALADVGIAMGAIGADATIEAADIALMKDDFGEIPEMMKLGRYTRRIARQNFVIWGTVNIIGLFLVLSRMIGPEGAASYNFLTDFLPMFNSLRLFNLHRKLK